jgi:hypothetical protein
MPGASGSSDGAGRLPSGAVLTAVAPLLRAPLKPYDRTRTILAGHWLFAVVLTLAAAVRAITMLGYRPAQLVWYDSYEYMITAAHLKPIQEFHPSGYPIFLWVLLPFHSIAVVAFVQHLLGLAIGVMIYALLRHKALPAWGATLATVPPLFDAQFLALEHAILADDLFIFLIVAAVTVLMWSDPPAAWQAAAAGLLLAMATLTRNIALPLLIFVPVYLIVRRARWRTVAALAVAGGLPVVMYAGLYAWTYGRFTVDGGDGVTLWARTMTFANCRVIKPPPAEVPLCPNGSHYGAASDYLWGRRSPINQIPGGFGTTNDGLARSFAVRAIAAQPGAYVHAVADDAMLAFLWTPKAHPKRLPPGFYFYRGHWLLPETQALVRPAMRLYDPGTHGNRSFEPYAGFLIVYQHITYLRGPFLAALLLLGLLGIRRSTQLPWGTAVFLLVAPVAVLDFEHRYVLPAVPLACIAAALGVASISAAWRARNSPNRNQPAQS